MQLELFPGKYKDKDLLQRFIDEHFPLDVLFEAGMFSDEMPTDYVEIADRLCGWLGYDTIYQYGSSEIRCHLSFDREESGDEPFVTILPNIYES